MTSEMTGRNQNMAPMWKKLTKFVDLGEPTSFLDHVKKGCTQRECEPKNTIFHERVSAATEKLPGWEKLRAKNCRVVL